jgi:hypothetical protein
MPRLLRRIEAAIVALGLGAPEAIMRQNIKLAANMALRQIGAKTILKMGDAGELLRAAIALEAAVD